MTVPTSVGATATVRRTCSSREEAETLLKALAPDNSTFVLGRTEGAELVLEARAASVGELQRTLDDALACLTAAERTWSSGGIAAPSQGRNLPERPEGNDDEGEGEG